MVFVMPLEADSKPKPKHRKSTCASCRRRKSKCDSKTPRCTTCVAYKDDCQYNKPPSLAYVRSLEEELHELKSQLRQVKTQVWLAKTTQNEDENLLSAPSAGEATGSHHSRRLQSLVHRNQHVKWETDISVDDYGGITFHNSTSAVHESPPSGAHTFLDQNATNSGYSSPQDDQQVKRDLVLNATHQRQIEPFAIANSAIKINIPKEVSLEILNYHWCWTHPLFPFVYRPAFTRGMAMVDYNVPDSRDPYFSETLLKVIHAHASRFLDYDVYQHQYQSCTNSRSPMATAFSPQDFSQRMLDEARYGLAIDMLKQSSIPTIQALLQQSAHEVVLGNASQAWTFAGVAFRMALDLGIHLPSDKLQPFMKSLTSEDIEIRKRLFWSCYTWDKILSLYLGRMPGFPNPATHDIPLTFMDDYSDTDLWVPYYGETPGPDHTNAPNYPPCPGYVVSCFRQLCKLCVILNDLMQSIYSPEAAARREEDEDSVESKDANKEPFIRISCGLRGWLLSLPSHLRISPDQMPQLAPPVHIVSLNLLYHTTMILLHRPMILGARDLSLPSPSRSYQICLQATAAIHDLLILQSNTFGLSHVSYLNAYSAYTAATVAVLRFERDCGDGEDYSSCAKASGLSFLAGVLDHSSSSMPVLERSSAIIRKRMRAVFEQRLDDRSHLGAYAAGSTAPNTQEMNLATLTVFQQSSATVSHGYSQAELNSGFVAAMQWQSGFRSSLYSEHSSVGDDFVPAFPGQSFPVGTEDSFGSSEVDSQGRSAMSGYSLYPYPRLNAGDIK